MDYLILHKTNEQEKFLLMSFELVEANDKLPNGIMECEHKSTFCEEGNFADE
jgi:hypothetical protein